jgi:TPR repeat protein
MRTRAQGMLFASGRKGFGRNHTAALHLFERGARLGNPQCAHNAGVLLSKGIGVPQNTTAAEMWLSIGAEAGFADSQFLLGSVHCVDELGVKWLRKAALQGHGEAANVLAIRYLKGLGTDKKPEAAIKWFRQAASMGNVGSMHNLARALSSGTKWTQRYVLFARCPRLAACTSLRGRCR